MSSPKEGRSGTASVAPHRKPAASPAWAYVVAVGLIAASLLLRVALRPWLGLSVPYLQFFPAIFLASWHGGLGPGIVATALSTLAAMHFFLPPTGSLALERPADIVSLPLFAATGLTIAWLNHVLRRTATLAESRSERLDTIINTTVDGIILISAHGTIEAFNRGAERLFGYAESEVRGRNVRMLMPPPHDEEHEGYLDRYLRTGEARIIGIGREVSGRRKDGSLFPLHLSVGETWLAGERKFTGMLHDLSARAQLVEQLRASEARWRAIIESAVDGIVVIDAGGRMEAFNPAAERLFGYSEQEVLGRNVKLLMPSPYRDEHDGYLARYLATGEARIIGIGREVTGLRKDGTTFPLHLSVGQITVGGEQKFTGILHDLSDRVRMEQQLRAQATLAGVGEMAAAIAHEVKNPLAGIRGAVQVIGGRLPPASSDRRMTDEIVARVDALDRMINELLLFSRPPKPRHITLDVLPLVEKTVNLLRKDPSLKEVEVEVAGAAPPITADAGMLQIIIQNLLINGAHAMKGRGKMRVAVEALDGACQIAFIDGGPGIPPELREKVFTPFFTTKARGTGLGLATVKRFAEAHGGEVAIECPLEGGTRVLVRLPSAAAAQPRA